MTREELRRIPQLNREIARKRAQLAFLREKATSVPALLPDPDKVQTSPSNNVNRYSDEAADVARELVKMEDQLSELADKAALFIDALPCSTETERLTRKIMRMRYVRCYTWDEIAELTGYELSYVHRLEKKAIPVHTVQGV